MDATGFQRPLWTKILSAGSMTAIVACFAIGQARAQFVNPVPPPPPPTFNPSTPNTVPQPPYVPAAPGGLPGAAPPSSLNESAPVPPPPPPALNPPSPSPAPQPPVTPVSPAARQPVNVPPAAKSESSRAQISHQGRLRHRWSRRHGRAYAARVIGPSYYPGWGVIYPPYPDPCHFSRVWQGYWVGSWEYTCF
jgi:hypothetical protein